MIKVFPLSINFENQDLWLGKSVSRGFGTVVQSTEHGLQENERRWFNIC